MRRRKWRHLVHCFCLLCNHSPLQDAAHHQRFSFSTTCWWVIEFMFNSNTRWTGTHGESETIDAIKSTLHMFHSYIFCDKNRLRRRKPSRKRKLNYFLSSKNPGFFLNPVLQINHLKGSSENITSHLEGHFYTPPFLTPASEIPALKEMRMRGRSEKKVGKVW